MATPEHYLYPERTSLSVERQIHRFQEAEAIGLTEKDTQDLLDWESPLGDKLETAVKPSSGSFDFPVDYLLTKEGKDALCDIFPYTSFDMGLLYSIETPEDAKKFMYQYSASFFVPEEDVDPSEDEEEEEMTKFDVRNFKLRRQDFRERAEKYVTDNFVTQYQNYLDGLINFDDIHNPAFITITGSAKKGLARIGGLKSLRVELKEVEAASEDSDTDTQELKEAKKIVLKMYKTRVNEYLAEGYIHRYGLKAKADVLGIESLSENEQKLLGLLPPMSLKNVDRLDKFLEGVEGEMVEIDYQQVSSRLVAEAKQKLAQYEMANIQASRDETLRRKGLDPQKIVDNPIDAEEMKGWLVEMLTAHDIPLAPEGAKNSEQGWRLNIEEGRKTISITGNVKKVNIPASFSRPVYNALPVARHENGHVLQHENRRTIPLKLFAKRGADRGSVFTEAGGKYLETDLEQEVFGLPPQEAFNIGYIFAIDARLKGGSFKDCFQAFLEPQLRLLDARQIGFPLPQASLEKERTSLVRESFNRTLRNFRNSFALEQSVPYVGESRATVYLEQLILVENLKKIGHLDLAFIARINFITLTYLKQLGFLDESQLISEINIARDVIWPRIKDRYTLEPAQV